MLRKRIKELQLYRNLGLRTPADIEKYEADFQKRVRRGVFTVSMGVAARILTLVCRLLSRTSIRSETTSQSAVSGAVALRQRTRDGALGTETTVKGHPSPASPAPVLHHPASCVRISCLSPDLPIKPHADPPFPSCAPQPREQPLPAPPHARRADTLLRAAHHAQAVPRHQGDARARVRPSRREAASARSP